MKQRILILKWAIGFFLAFLIVPETAFATLDVMSITTNPKTPGPNQDVTVTLKSFALPLTSSQIVWYINKEPVKEGIGATTFSTKTGDLGESITVDIAILTPEGVKVNKQIILAPAEVDLLWEAQTYTPPFYKGKALPTYNSLIKVSAIPRFNSTSSDPLKFYYKWTLNRTLGLGNGFGKSSVLVPATWPGSTITASVDVGSTLASINGSNEISIRSVNPKIVFYEQAPLFGVRFDHAMRSSIATVNDPFVIRAVPYFFSTDNMDNGDLVYTLVIDNQRVAAKLTPNIITLTKTSGGNESHSVSLRIQNPKRIMQDANAVTGVNIAATPQ